LNLYFPKLILIFFRYDLFQKIFNLMTKKLKTQRLPSAFSLIEVSIVVLLIGLIVAGVAQAGRLVAESALTSARTQTKGAPVIQTDDLVLWYETTLEDSFLPSEQDDGLQVSVWYDINPITGKKPMDALSAGAARPTFTTKAINGLPALKFSGAQYLTPPDGSLPYKNSPFTVFIVSKITTGASGTIIGTGPSGTNTWFKYSSAAGAFTIDGGSGGGSLTGIATAQDSFRIISSTYDGTVSSTTANKAYVNGAIQTLAGGTSTIRNSDRTPVTIGADPASTPSANFLNGMIAEIIVFQRALDDSERASIERYLGKKWKIKLS